MAEEWGEAWRRCALRWTSFGRKVTRAAGWKVWNPGIYGEPWHARFRSLYPPVAHPVVIFGLNPGPYGMAQTGIPFTDVLRLRRCLPRLAALLGREFGEVAVPGLAPRELRPHLTRTFESSAVRVYRLLEQLYGSAEVGCRALVVANPCPLLFLGGEPGKAGNVTPADLPRAVRRRGGADAGALTGEMNRLRLENIRDAVESLEPRAAVLLGKDVQRAVGEDVRRLLGKRPVIDQEHPARAVPERWAAELGEELARHGVLPSPRELARGA